MITAITIKVIILRIIITLKINDTNQLTGFYTMGNTGR